MNHCKKPCNDCPFRKNSLPGWLADYSAQELHNIVMVAEQPFPCHMTHQKKELSWDQAGTEEHPLCAGALLYMKKACKLPRRSDLSVIIRSFPREETENILSVPEFFEHHKK